MDTGGFELVEESLVHEGFIIRVMTATFRAPDGTLMKRDVVRHMGAVSVVPVIDDEVILVRQFRAAIGHLLLEIPAGKRDVPGEAPEITAVRELQEEIGQVPGKLEHLSSFYNSPGFADEFMDVYLATDLTATEATAHGVEEEHMAIEPYAIDDIPRLIADGDVVDAKSIIGLLLAHRRLRG